MGKRFSKKTMKDAKMHGFKVLYADTDGFFVTPKKIRYLYLIVRWKLLSKPKGTSRKLSTRRNYKG